MAVQVITSICAIVIALAALFVSVWSGVQTRKHNRLSVRPNLRVNYYDHSERPLSILISNDGLGPALIYDFSISIIEGNKVPEKLNNFYACVNGDDLKYLNIFWHGHELPFAE